MSRPRIHFSIVFSALSLSLTISHADSSYEYCPQNTSCGDTNISYPFGVIGRHGKYGCGVPQFQVYCVDYHPLLPIGGNNYSILQPKQLGFPSHGPITIVKDVANVGDCNPSDYFIDLWDTTPFTISDQYAKNITFFSLCDSLANGSSFSKLSCNSSWYLLDPLEGLGESGCKIHGQVPINRSLIDALPSDWFSQLRGGFEVMWNFDENQSCKECHPSGGRCGYNTLSGDEFICYCEDGPNGKKCSHDRSKLIPVIGSCVAGVAVIAVAVLILTCYLRRRKPPTNRRLARDINHDQAKDMEAALPGLTIGNLPVFSYEELQEATNDFAEKNELGDGGFGSVYLGKLRDGRAAAVKRLYQDNSRRLQQFMNEVELFSSLHHPNLVRLFGCSSPSSPELLLVYEYVPNGTLADHLHGELKGKALLWNTRLNIAIETAQALAFLHSVEPPIFHRDVKTSNILLDENFTVKLADFGLSRLVPLDVTHVTTAPQGTPGYLDPDYHQCYQLTEKSDVYSFGVVLVEIISAKLAVDITRNRKEISLANMAIAKIQNGALHELVDPNLEIELNPLVKAMVSGVAELALRCLAAEKDDRPHMKEVVTNLEQIRQMGCTACPDKKLSSDQSPVQSSDETAKLI